MYRMDLRRNKWCACIRQRYIIKQLNVCMYIYIKVRVWVGGPGGLMLSAAVVGRPVCWWEWRRVHSAAAGPAPLVEWWEGGARKRYSDLDPHRRRALRVPVLPPPHCRARGRGGGRSTRPALSDIRARASSFFTRRLRSSSLKYIIRICQV